MKNNYGFCTVFVRLLTSLYLDDYFTKNFIYYNPIN